jgi:hypothetical protein
VYTFATCHCIFPWAAGEPQLRDVSSKVCLFYIRDPVLDSQKTNTNFYIVLNNLVHILYVKTQNPSHFMRIGYQIQNIKYEEVKVY